VAPVFLLAAVGFGWVRFLRWDYPVSFVTRLAMTLAVPCLIFDVLVHTELDPAALGAVALATIVGYGALTALFWVLVRMAHLTSRTFLAPLIFGNTGNLGLPLAFFAYGEVGLGYAIVVFATMALMAFTYGIWLVAGRGAGLRVLAEPMVVATLLGGLFLWQGWRLPAWLGEAVQLVGQLGIPLMLITLGVAVAQMATTRLRQAIWLSLTKAAVSAGVALIVAMAFALEPVARAVIIVQMITPVAVTSYLLAERFDADAKAVAGLVVVSTLLSVLTLPVAIAVLGLP